MIHKASKKSRFKNIAAQIMSITALRASKIKEIENLAA